jgi:hypothetical protein
VYSRSSEEHAAHVNGALGRLEEIGFTLNPEKLVLGVPEIKYLGHIISPRGIKVLPKKVETIQRYPRPNFVRNMLDKFKLLGCKMSLKLHFLASYLDYFPPNLGAVSEEQGERFHQDLKDVERRCQGRWDVNMTADYFWSIARDDALREHSRTSRTYKFYGKRKRATEEFYHTIPRNVMKVSFQLMYLLLCLLSCFACAISLFSACIICM